MSLGRCLNHAHDLRPGEVSAYRTLIIGAPQRLAVGA